MKVLTADQFKQQYGEAGVAAFAPTTADTQESQPGFIDRVKTDLKGNLDEALNAENNSIDGKTNPFSAGATIAKDISGSVIAPLAEAPGVRQLGEAFGKLGKHIVDSPLGNKVTDYLASKLSPEALKTISDLAETGLNVSAIEGMARGGGSAADTTLEAAGKVKGAAGDTFSTITSKLPQALSGDEGVATKVKEFLARDPDEKTATILKETPKEKFDQFLKYGEQASKDPRALTPFDYVGDTMEKATKILKTEMKKVGEQKSAFLSPLRQGFDAFNAKSLVDDLTSLHNRLPESDRGFVRNLISKAKEIKTKQAADRFIDETQDSLKTAGQQNVIPKGSALQRQVSGLVGKFNGSLKEVLPKEYSTLNARYANLKNVTDALNKALGEVVDGQSTRGGSLVKQFFSPSGKKAKVIFDYVKKNTGIDLAQDSTLAKFVMEIYDDPRGRSLLEGIPNSASGIIKKIVDIGVEKTGVGKNIQKSVREGEINKARRMTK